MSDELKPGDGIKIDNDTTYEYGADLNADSTPIIDAGEGKEIVIRTFEYRFNLKGKPPVDKQAIFNGHAAEIKTFLWADGLRYHEGFPPRVAIDKDKRGYKIHIVCEGAKGLIFTDKPKNLSEELAKSNKGKLDTPTM